MINQNSQGTAGASPGMQTKGISAQRNISATLETLDSLVAEVKASSDETFQRLFVHLVVFVSIDLKQAMSQQGRGVHQSYAQLLEDGISGVSRRFVTGDLKPNAIRARVMPLILSSVSMLRGDNIGTIELEEFAKQWESIGITVGASGIDV